MRTRILGIFVAAALLLVLANRSAWAQQTQNGVPVQMIVSVEAKHGAKIPAITQHDIIVHQGHNVRQVTGWAPTTGENAGLALAILIDDSAGLSFGSQLNDIRNFIQEQAPRTLVFVGYMQNGTVFTTQNFTQDHAAAAHSVRLAQGFAAAEASPYVSLSDMIKRWPTNPAVQRREVLMITSGIDSLYMGTIPDPYVDAAVQDAQCAGVVVYSIYTPSAGHMGHSRFLTYWGQNFLSELSEETGGESYYLIGPQAPVSFAPYLRQFNQQLSNQFLLTFLAEPQKKAGRQPVKVTSEIHSVDFVHANQVCVPAAAE